MDWIKRNLYFVIFMVIALILMGSMGWYLYSSYNQNTAEYALFQEAYANLKQLNDQNPNPGETGPDKVDNVTAAKAQDAELRKFVDSTRPYYSRIKRIPDLAQVTDHDFATALSLTIAQMLHAASNANVLLPSEGYGFSFEAERRLMVFHQEGLLPLSAQLGEVKTILDVLFDAKVNSLDGLRRERVSPDDNGAETDYLDQRSTTNTMAILTPYEVTFRAFSAEIASVLSGFASSPYGLVVKAINVEPAAVEEAPTTTPTMTPVVNPTPIVPRYPTQPQSRYGDIMQERYGRTMRPPVTPVAVTPVPMAPVAPARPAGALPTVLDERKLKVTILVDVVKLLEKDSPAKQVARNAGAQPPHP